MADLFIDDDEGFRRWLETHPHGYVLNAERKPLANYLILHRATCPSFKCNRGRYWTRTYLKVCSTDSRQLRTWAERTVSRDATLTPCQRCEP